MEAASPFDQLTDREREVLELLRRGLTDAEVGARLGISRGTASDHVSAILRKLDVRNRHEAAYYPERPPWWLSIAPPFLRLRPIPSLAAIAAIGLLAAVLAGLGLVVWLLARDGGGSARPAETYIVFHAGSLRVATADRPTESRLIARGTVNASYAGYARRADGGIDIYFLAIPVRQDAASFILYRVAAEQGDPQAVLERVLPANDPYASAAISPNGMHVIVTSVNGVELIDIQSQEHTALIQRSCASEDPFCPAYQAINWNPQGDAVALYRSSLEVPTLTIIQPLQEPPSVIDTEELVLDMAWSPDGDRLCIHTRQGVTGGRLVIFDIATRTKTDVLQRLTGDVDLPDAFGCAWSHDGVLAAAYWPDYPNTAARLAFFDEDLNVISETDPIDVNSIVGWLGDGSGIVIDRRPQDGTPRSPAIVHPDGSLVDLGITPIDAVLDVIATP